MGNTKKDEDGNGYDMDDVMLKHMMRMKRDWYTCRQIGNILDIPPKIVDIILSERMSDYEDYSDKARKKRIKQKYKEKIKNVKKELEEREINAKNACIFMSCKPTQQSLDDFTYIPEIERNYEKIKGIIVEIEKRMMHLCIFKATKTVLSTAIYLGTRFTKKDLGAITGTSLSTIQRLLNDVKLRKKKD